MEPTDTTATIGRSGFPLGVKCNFCLHRALLDEKALAGKFANPRLLSSLRFKCGRCGGQNVHIEKFWSRSSVTKFMRRDE